MSDGGGTPGGMDLVELAPSVYACLQEDKGLGTSNSGLVTRGGGLVVDTFWDLPHTRELIATPPASASSPAYTGTSCMSMKGDLPGLSNLWPGTIGSCQ